MRTIIVFKGFGDSNDAIVPAKNKPGNLKATYGERDIYDSAADCIQTPVKLSNK